MITAPGLTGCGAPREDAQARSLVNGCPAPSPDVVFFDNFEAGNLSKWISYTTQPNDPGHSWAIDGTTPVFAGVGQVRSDLAGPTVARYYNRLDTVPFSLAGRKSARLRLATRHKVATNGIYQIFIRNFAGTKVSLIGDFAGQNLAWPAFEIKDIQIPAAFLGEPAVRISLLMQAGGLGGDFGAVVDNVLVSAEPEVPSCDVAFADSFESGNLAKWDVLSDPGAAGHVWALATAPATSCASTTEARSDLAGLTLNLNYTRLETKPFSLVGRSTARLLVQARWQMGSDDRFQIFFADRDTNDVRSLVGDFTGQNSEFPNNSALEIPLPAMFLGKPRISVAFLSLTGNATNPGIGAGVDDVRVLTDCGVAQ